MASIKFVRDQARRILNEFEITVPPVPVQEIIEGFALTIEETQGEDWYDGELVPELRLIKINGQKPTTRQRFTLAHELGHWVLFHKKRLFDDERPIFDMAGEALNDDDFGLHIDRDQEANIFAAELLMPTQWVRSDWKRYKDDVNGLAGRYEVSPDAMWVKVLELGLIK